MNIPGSYSSEMGLAQGGVKGTRQSLNSLNMGIVTLRAWQGSFMPFTSHQGCPNPGAAFQGGVWAPRSNLRAKKPNPSVPREPPGLCRRILLQLRLSSSRSDPALQRSRDNGKILPRDKSTAGRKRGRGKRARRGHQAALRVSRAPGWTEQRPAEHSPASSSSLTHT